MLFIFEILILNENMMKAQLVVSEILRQSWKFVKSQIWILAGLFIAFMLIYFTISIFCSPLQASLGGGIILSIINMFILSVFGVGYLKNMLQTIDGDEPQFSAYIQSFPNILNYFLASILSGLASLIGCIFFIVPGIYFYIRLQFFGFFIVEEKQGAIDALRSSWQLTKDQGKPLFLLFLSSILFLLLGFIVFIIGAFVAYPFLWMIQAYTYLSPIITSSFETTDRRS